MSVQMAQSLAGMVELTGLVTEAILFVLEDFEHAFDFTA